VRNRVPHAHRRRSDSLDLQRNIPARNRTWSSTFAESCALHHTPGTEAAPQRGDLRKERGERVKQAELRSAFSISDPHILSSLATRHSPPVTRHPSLPIGQGGSRTHNQSPGSRPGRFTSLRTWPCCARKEKRERGKEFNAPPLANRSERPAGVEPACRVWQTRAWPIGQGRDDLCHFHSVAAIHLSGRRSRQSSAFPGRAWERGGEVRHPSPCSILDPRFTTHDSRLLPPLTTHHSPHLNQDGGI
jgi:hypothetical protein